MIKYCLDKWNKNHKRLEEALSKDAKLNSCNYAYLVKMVVEYVLTDEKNNRWDNWDANRISVIDNGDYQGTQLFLIPTKAYQPAEYDYLMTYVGYGSCGGCDTLMNIQGWDNKAPTPEQLKDYMTLCKDLITNMIKPYNCGWREKDCFKEVVME